MIRSLTPLLTLDMDLVAPHTQSRGCEHPRHTTIPVSRRNFTVAHSNAALDILLPQSPVFPPPPSASPHGATHATSFYTAV